MSPSNLYFQHCKKYGLSPDAAQVSCIQEFDRLWRDILADETRTETLWNRLFSHNTPASIKGVYLWGGVGRGKTMLMDICYAAIKTRRKQRQHFHHFMLHIHKSLKKLKKSVDPLKILASDLAKHIKVLCLDEFHVNDITDAMLLHTLLKALITEGVVIVTTSNFKPGALYSDGLQRARFLPTIDLINSQTQVIKLDGHTDYRLKALQIEGTWHQPLNSASRKQMQNAFAKLSSHISWNNKSIEINNRKVAVLGQAEGAVWFDFKILCDSPRSQSDFIEIARQHHSVLLSNLPILTDQYNDAARRFLNLLDILYDHRVKLIASAAAPIEKIFSGEKLAFESKRATSRLFEMQTDAYLAQVHQ